MSDVSDGYDRLLSMLTGDGALDTRRVYTYGDVTFVLAGMCGGSIVPW